MLKTSRRLPRMATYPNSELCNVKLPPTALPQVQKSAEHYTEAAHDEIDLLAAIAKNAELAPEGAAACVQMRDKFEHRGPHGRHVCMVFEVGHA